MTSDSPRGARVIPGIGSVLASGPITVVTGGDGETGLAALSMLDGLATSGRWTFESVAAALHEFVVAANPPGVAAVLDVEGEPIVFAFDQAEAVAGDIRAKGDGRAGWTTEVVGAFEVELRLASVPYTGKSTDVVLRDGMVPGAGAIVAVDASKVSGLLASAASGETPPPAADSVPPVAAAASVLPPPPADEGPAAAADVVDAMGEPAEVDIPESIEASAELTDSSNDTVDTAETVGVMAPAGETDVPTPDNPTFDSPPTNDLPAPPPLETTPPPPPPAGDGFAPPPAATDPPLTTGSDVPTPAWASPSADVTPPPPAETFAPPTGNPAPAPPPAGGGFPPPPAETFAPPTGNPAPAPPPAGGGFPPPPADQFAPPPGNPAPAPPPGGFAPPPPPPPGIGSPPPDLATTSDLTDPSVLDAPDEAVDAILPDSVDDLDPGETTQFMEPSAPPPGVTPPAPPPGAAPPPPPPDAVPPS